eukprot:3444802-Pyramimonas_sp.AAC.1
MDDLLPQNMVGRMQIEGLRPESSSIQAWTPVLCERTSTVGQSSKIFQSEVGMGMLLRMGGQYLYLVLPSVTHLQVLERGTAKCVQEALVRQSAVSPIANTFARKLRSACTDKGSSNLVVESSYVSSPEHQDWHRVWSACDVHVTATVFKFVFALTQTDITGMIRHSLSINVAGQLNCFRKALRQEIKARGVHIRQ